ncbi:MAG: twin-arginine translocase TatA/TatE family subunit [Phycisphaerales bacterium]
MPTLGLFSSIGPLEIGILLLVGLLLFGRRLPEVGRGLGRSITEFKRGLKDVTDDVDDATREVRELNAADRTAAGAPGSVARSPGEPVRPASNEGGSGS